MGTLDIYSEKAGITVEYNGVRHTMDDKVLHALCRCLVQGRDVEDALAPTYVVEQWVYLVTETTDIAWKDIDLPEDHWLYDIENAPGAKQEFGLTPVVKALSLLDYLGGGYTTHVTMERV
jgi:hypothetical protein